MAHTFFVRERYLRIHAEHLMLASYLERVYYRLRWTAPLDYHSPCDEGEIGWDGRGDVIATAVREAGALFNTTIARLRAHSAVPAAAVVSPQAAIAFFGRPRIGKTTLVLELLRRGWQTFGDELFLLEPATGVAHPFPRAFRVPESAFRMLRDEALMRTSRRDLLVTGDAGSRVWQAIDPAEVFRRNAFSEPRRITHVVLLDRSVVAQRSTIEPISKETASSEDVPVE
ncbi:MAG: hypothetical protein JO101_08840, partial [Candidatus Eremiobacteraeota bacterium]|nr:hypothetical protein [Candidatus Eremiobacteraeota bacterium]